MLRDKESVATRCGVTWQERGPSQDDDVRKGAELGDQVATAAPGGMRTAVAIYKECYTELARSGNLVVKHTDPRTGINKGRGKGKLTGKDSDECKGQGSSSDEWVVGL